MRVRRSRWIPVGLVAVAALAAACGSSPNAGTAASTPGQTGTTQATTGGAPGVTGSTIHIGVYMIDFGSITQLTHGLSYGDYQGAYQALIKQVNRNGGINGRKIAATFVKVNPLQSAAASAACTQLVQDDQVFAVIGQFNGNEPLCILANPSDPTPVVGGTMTDALLGQAKALWVSTSPVSDVVQPATVAAAAKAGVFRGKVVGLLTASDDPPGLDARVRQALDQAGVTPSVSTIVQNDAGDVQATFSQISGVIVPKFQSAGVNVVVAVGDSVLTWTDAGGGGSSYHPQLVASSESILSSALTGSKPKQGVLNAAVSAWTRPLVNGGKSVGWSDPLVQSCARTIKASGVRFSSPVGGAPSSSDQSYMAVAGSCQIMNLFTSIARKAGRDLTRASFTQAADTLGTVQVPGLGTATYNAANLAGSFPMYLYKWDAAADQWAVGAQEVGNT